MKERVVVLALFQYRTFQVPLEVRDAGTVELRVRCPLCGKQCRLDLEVHKVLSLHPLTIHPVISCPGCSWRVVVSGGRAFDVAASTSPGPSAIATSHSERIRECAACGEVFSSKTHDRCQKCRDATARPIAAHQRFKLK